MNEEFVYLKLVTGEQLMAYKESETETSISIKYPMLIKTHMIASDGDRVSEQVTAGPYSLFLQSPVVHLNKSHIVLDSKLHERAIVHYVQLVKNHEGISLVNEAKQLLWDDEERQNFEAIPDATSAIAQLSAVVEESEEVRTYVEGNETVH
jgi:hypothetical protein